MNLVPGDDAVVNDHARRICDEFWHKLLDKQSDLLALKARIECPRLPASHSLSTVFF